MPERTPRGKWVIYDAETGERLERWPVDAKDMLATDEFVAEPPEGGAEGEAAEADPEAHAPDEDGEGAEPEGSAEGEADTEGRVIGIEAERASRLREQWDKATPPAEYIERYGEETDAGQLARKILDAEEAAKGAEPSVTGEAGPAEPVELPDARG